MTNIKLIKSLPYLRSLAGCLLLLLASQPALAFNFTTNSTTDAVDSTPGDGICETALANGICTLRAAIQESNAGDLDITDALSLRGVSESVSIIDAADIDRVLDIHNVDVQIENLTIQNGQTIGVEGGGIRSVLGALTIRNSTLSSNETTGFGFGGGGLYSSGPLIIDNATITNNRSSRGAGILQFSNNMTISNSHQHHHRWQYCSARRRRWHLFSLRL